MEEKQKCIVYGDEVTVVDGACQEDCSIEECTLNPTGTYFSPEKEEEVDSKNQG